MIRKTLLLALTAMTICPVWAQTDDGLQDTLQRVTVFAAREKPRNTTQTGLTRLDAKTLKTSAVVFGAPDVIKSLQLLPGVAAGNELMSGMFVHGGDGTDNLFLLDGVPIYNISHFGGIFSSFNTDVINSIDFYKSGFPARYGGRASSVVDVTTNPGDNSDFHGTVSLGIADGRLQLEGPIVKGKTSFNVSYRRSWLDMLTSIGLAIANRNSDAKIDAYSFMQDLNAGITHVFDDNNRLRANFFFGNDKLKAGMKEDKKMSMAMDVKWGNLLGSVIWDRRYSRNLSSSLTAYYSQNTSDIGYDVTLDAMGGAAFKDDVISGVKDAGLKYDFSWYPAESHHIRLGADGKFKHYGYEGFAADGNKESNTLKYKGMEGAFYIEDEMFLLSSLTLNAGLRYALIGAGSRLYHSLEPRAALKWRISNRADIKASYTRMSQSEHLVASNYIDLPTNCWMPSTPDIRPVLSDQVAGGVYTHPFEGASVNVEGWYKTMKHLLTYAGTNSLFPPVVDWESSFVEGEGKSYGMEAEISWANSFLSLTAYYTLSWSLRKFVDMYPDWYSDRNDNRHKINLIGSVSLGRGFEINANWAWHSGNKVTFPSNVLADGTVLYDRPFNSSLPVYHRLDLGASYKHILRNGSEFSTILSIYNAYNRKNAYFAYLSPDGKGSYKGTAYSVIPIIPTLSISYKF